MEVRLEFNDDLAMSQSSIVRVLEQLERQQTSELNIALINLLKASAREMLNLTANSGDLTLVSLSTRNIFELYLILLAVRSSDRHLKSWFGQAHRDSKEVRDGFAKVVLKKGLDVSQLREIQEFEDRALKESPYESKKGFNIKDLANDYGYLDDYLAVYKLSSKLIHPTSMKVNTYDVLLGGSNFLNVVKQMSMFFSQKIERFALTLVDESV